MSGRSLAVLFNGELMGTLEKLRNNRLRFSYEESWLHGPLQMPLSLSMPLLSAVHPDASISPFLWNLLPDNEHVIRTWAQRFQVSASSAFDLLRNVGQDVAGAVQFVEPEQAAAVESGGRLRPLSEEEVAAELAALRRDPALGRQAWDMGQFSLGGAQAKTALQRTPTGWAVPSGREPTTHILKPPRPELAGHVENEHFCLRLAVRVGLSVAQSAVMRFVDELAIVVTRYDRVHTEDGWLRLHQEDLCQALRVPPTDKYESRGGPGIKAIMAVLAGSSKPGEDRESFMLAIVYNYLIGGTDAHAKNYSLLHAPGGRYRLAPLYDIASVLPYADRQKDLELAMGIGGHRKIAQIMPRHFAKEARAARYSAEQFLVQLRDCAHRLPDLAATTAEDCRADGIEHPVLAKLVDSIAARCATTLRRFDAEAAAEG
jgi:serine/threonine-protein kinase HipA